MHYDLTCSFTVLTTYKILIYYITTLKNYKPPTLVSDCSLYLLINTELQMQQR